MYCRVEFSAHCLAQFEEYVLRQFEADIRKVQHTLVCRILYEPVKGFMFGSVHLVFLSVQHWPRLVVKHLQADDLPEVEVGEMDGDG